MRRNISAQQGFTLAELLVATALGLIVLGLVGYSYHNVTQASNRALALIKMHQQAAAFLSRLEAEVYSANSSNISVAGGGNTLQLEIAAPGATDDTTGYLSKGVCYQYDSAISRLKYASTGGANTNWDVTNSAAAPASASDDFLQNVTAVPSTPVFALTGSHLKVNFRLKQSDNTDALYQDFKHWIPIGD